MKNSVIAERSKILHIPTFILSLVGVICCLIFIIEPDESKSISLGVFILLLITSIALLLLSLYGFLNPKDAIIKNGNCLIIKYFFCKIIISIDKIENVSITERGEYYNRESTITSDIEYFNDIRRLTINYKENGVLCHKTVFVKNASAVKCSIDSLLDK